MILKSYEYTDKSLIYYIYKGRNVGKARREAGIVRRKAVKHNTFTHSTLHNLRSAKMRNVDCVTY